MTGCLALLARKVMCEFSQCYNDVNICLWIDGSQLSQSEAQSACQQRNSFLPRVINSNIQSKLGLFRSGAWNLFGDNAVWIDVQAVEVNSFHWIDGSVLAGWLLCLVFCGLRYP